MKPSIFFALAGSLAPSPVGGRPRFALPAALLAALSACAPGSSDQVVPPIDLGMTSGMDAGYTNQAQMASTYEVQMPVQLPVRKPTSADLKGLSPNPKGTGYPRAPYLKTTDESVEVHYTISNIDSQQHDVWMLIDPWNEFVRWRPGITLTQDGPVPNQGFQLVFVVPPRSRIDGTLTPDDITELAIRLASAENLLNSPQAKAALATDAGTMGGFDPGGYAQHMFNPQNHSNGNDPIFTPWIPPVIAGLTGFDLGLRTIEAANVAVEITMQIQDLNGNRLVSSGSSIPQIGLPPVTLGPPGAM